MVSITAPAQILGPLRQFLHNCPCPNIFRAYLFCHLHATWEAVYPVLFKIILSCVIFISNIHDPANHSTRTLYKSKYYCIFISMNIDISEDPLEVSSLNTWLCEFLWVFWHPVTDATTLWDHLI